MNLTMGSLFDGIGGFPLAAERYGIKTLWASEIEPFPMKVTGRRFPGMAHKGDITKLNGRLLLPVDIICGGSPCQDDLFIRLAVLYEICYDYTNNIQEE